MTLDITTAIPNATKPVIAPPLLRIAAFSFPNGVAPVVEAAAGVVLDVLNPEDDDGDEVVDAEGDTVGVGREVVRESVMEVESVPTVMVDIASVVDWEAVSEVGMGRVRVAEGMGLSKDPVIPSNRNHGE